MRKRAHILIIGGAIALSLIIMILSFGYYPIALVNGHIITAHAFELQAKAVTRYREVAAETYVVATTTPATSSTSTIATGMDMPTSILDALIEDQIVRGGLNQLVGDGAQRIVREKVQKYESNPELHGASVQLFSLTPEVFAESILTPQAEREVLSSKLFLQGQTLNSWLKDARKTASVRIFSGAYKWNGDRVERAK